MALDDVSLTIEHGTVHALVGENGSGKSTLMRILHGELHCDSGSITLGGNPYEPSDVFEANRSGVALIHQELALCDHLTVTENIFLGAETLRGGRLAKREMSQRARELLALLGHSEFPVDQKVRSLSTAKKQLVEIARGMRSDAKVLLFDEPTSSLGRHDVESLFQLIARLRSQGKTVVYITHFLDEVAAIADKATVLRDGKVVGEYEMSKTSLDPLVTSMSGRAIDQTYPRSKRNIGEVVLRAENLSGKKISDRILVRSSRWRSRRDCRP